jgi:hypothetical protein
MRRLDRILEAMVWSREIDFVFNLILAQVIFVLSSPQRDCEEP